MKREAMMATSNVDILYHITRNSVWYLGNNKCWLMKLKATYFLDFVISLQNNVFFVIWCLNSICLLLSRI